MLKIAQITDLHLLPPGKKLMGLDVVERFESVLAHAEQYEPDAYFFTGDFCASTPEMEEFIWLGHRLRALGKPFYIVPGNHDDRQMLRDNLALPGEHDEPINQRVELNGKVFLLLDTRYAEVEKDQLDWLSDQLARYENAYIVMHHPPVKLGQPFMDNNYPLSSPERLQRILRSQQRPVHVFCGHYHGGRTVTNGNITVHLCPPTSFFIKPDAEVFEQDDLPAAYQQLEWNGQGRMTVTPIYLPESPPIPAQ